MFQVVAKESGVVVSRGDDGNGMGRGEAIRFARELSETTGVKHVARQVPKLERHRLVDRRGLSGG